MIDSLTVADVIYSFETELVGHRVTSQIKLSMRTVPVELACPQQIAPENPAHVGPAATFLPEEPPGGAGGPRRPLAQQPWGRG